MFFVIVILLNFQSFCFFYMDKQLVQCCLFVFTESSKKNGEEASMFRGCVDLPVYEQINIESEENWDAGQFTHKDFIKIHF